MFSFRSGSSVFFSHAPAILRFSRSFSKSLLSDDVYSSSSFYKTMSILCSSLHHNVLPLQQRRSPFLSDSSFVPRSLCLYHSVALRFSPSRRGCNRASLSRARYTRGTDVCSRCPFLGEASRCPRCTREFLPQSGATKKNPRCIFVAFIGLRYRPSRRSRDVACGLFRLLRRSDCPSPSDIRRITDVPSSSSQWRTSRVLSQLLLLQTRNAIDSLAPLLRCDTVLSIVLTQSPFSVSCNVASPSFQ